MTSASPYILVIEDDPWLRELVEITLREEGYETTGTPDGLPALHLAVQRCPSLILLDLHTPNLDGRSFARLYHALPGPHAPLIFLSGAPDLDVIARAAGAHGALAKPFNLEDLVATVQRHALSALTLHAPAI